jgi:DNA-binding protein YbaB
MTRTERKQKKLRNIEQRAAKLQVEMDKLQVKWDAAKQEVEASGGTVDYRFGDVLA